MDRHYFNPTPDTIYTNKGGGSYICPEAEGHFRAKFQRVSKSKWTFVAHGCQMYEDGTIEWDSSTGGYFEEYNWDFKSHISIKEIAKYETELYRQKSFFRYNR